ncbi:MAG: 5 protein, partial [Campylobacterota bacterium]|nr:5 protein [Campylobacterota bacterium]
AVGSQFFTYYKNFSKALTIKRVEEYILQHIELKRKEIVAKIQSELLSERPKIWISEVAERLFEKYIKAKKNREILIVFLDSIPLEILASLFEGVRASSKDRLAKFALFEGGKEIIDKIADKIKF